MKKTLGASHRRASEDRHNECRDQLIKKECGSSSSKTNKPKQADKKQAPKKAATKKTTDKKKRAARSGHGKISHPKTRSPRKMRLLLLNRLKIKSIIGARTITMARVCGHSTIHIIVRVTHAPIAQHPMPTSLLSTPWTVTLTRSDCCTRVKASLGSG